MQRILCKIALGLSLGTLIGGCAPQRERPELTDLREPTGAKRSLALNPAEMRRLPQARPGVPWYAVRNEYERATEVGTAGPTVQSAETRTYDRIGSSHGQVHDHYRRTTRRRRYRETVD